MTIDWSKFLPALVLLLLPGDLLNAGTKVRYRDVTREWSGYWLLALTHVMHVADFARALGGAWLLFHALQVPATARGLLKYEPLLVQGGVRVLAVWLQTVVCREKDAINAPFAFVTGLLLGGVAPVATLFAFALALPAALGSRAAIAFFPVLGLAHLGIGFWFNGKSVVPTLVFGLIATVVPTLWALLFRRDLVVAHRAKRLDPARDHSPLR